MALIVADFSIELIEKLRPLVPRIKARDKSLAGQAARSTTMARWYLRRRRKAPRKKARFRVEGMTAAELGAKVGVSARTVRFYTAERVLPSPEFRGAATRYGREHLVCLAAIGGCSGSGG